MAAVLSLGQRITAGFYLSAHAQDNCSAGSQSLGPDFPQTALSRRRAFGRPARSAERQYLLVGKSSRGGAFSLRLPVPVAGRFAAAIGPAKRGRPPPVFPPPTLGG